MYDIGSKFEVRTSLGNISRHIGKHAVIVSNEGPRSYGTADVLGLSGRVIDTICFRGSDLPA